MSEFLTAEEAAKALQQLRGVCVEGSQIDLRPRSRRGDLTQCRISSLTESLQLKRLLKSLDGDSTIDLPLPPVKSAIRPMPSAKTYKNQARKGAPISLKKTTKQTNRRT